MCCNQPFHAVLQTVFGRRMLVRQGYNADQTLNFEKQIKMKLNAE
jgi:hypothetical protein